ncbi:MAG: hypothetical protein AAF202_03490 [Pseudomonadota bacterium]
MGGYFFAQLQFSSYIPLMSQSVGYTRVLIAIPLLLAGMSCTAMPFVPLTDDFGNPMEQSLALQAAMFLTGLALLFLSIYICIPSLFESEESQPKN